ncbi:MAG: Gfo/Idh/MocA family oxidoreductase [Candidatus Latescibacterota bacterium]
MAIRLGIIGMGYTGQQHLWVTQKLQGMQAVVATDADPARLRDLPAGVRPVPDWRRVVEDPEVDAVTLCLPHAAHAEVGLAALECGKHLLIEKPLAVDLTQAEALAAAARASGRVVMVEMTHRFYPPVRAGKALVESGRLGRVYAVEDCIVQRVEPGGLPAWMFDRAQAGGGVAMTNGVHMLDRMAWISGQPLRFLSGRAGWTHGLGDVEDTAAMLLELADGTPAAFLAAWPLVRRQTDPARDTADELTVYGTGGTLRIWSWRGWSFDAVDGQREEHDGYPEGTPRPERPRLGMAGALREFAAAIQQGRPAAPGADEILKVQRLLDQFYRYVGVVT